MRVSIVIPLYNKAKHIDRAIKSALRQTYVAFELIVVDDGSTDGGGDRVREFNDNRIRLVSQKNVGVGAARNQGVSKANGKLVAFLDADDEWMPDFLETVVRLHSRFPQAKVWGTAYAMHDGNGRLTPAMPVETGEACLINYWAAAILTQPMNASSIMVEREALQAAGGFHQTLVRLEDSELLARMALRHPIAYSPEIKAIYHMEADNRTEGYIYSGVYPFFEAARSYLRECGNRISLPRDAERYCAAMQIRALRPNWLAGNRAAMREIIRDCHNISGFRMQCVWWGAVSLIPYKLVLAGWACRRLVAWCLRRRGKMQPTRCIYRSTVSNCEEHPTHQ